MDRPPQEPAPDLQAPSPTNGPRVRRGRERGIGAPGDRLVARLGPVSPEAAPFHNPDQLALLADRELGVDRPGEWPSDETQLEDLGFVALDCETTGHFPHRMVELGAVRFQLGAPGRPSQPRLSLESLVHTEDHINPYARRVHGIHASMLSGAPTLRRVATAFDELARGTVLVEHSADGFDTRLVSRALGRPLPHHHLDTSRIAGFLFELRDTIGLERLCEQLGVTHRSPHFALADSEATADCFVKLVQIGQERFGWRNLGDLLAVGMPPIPRLAPKPRPRRAVAAAPAPAAERAAGGAVAGGPERPARRRRRGGRGRRRKSTADSADQPSSDLSQPAVQ